MDDLAPFKELARTYSCSEKVMAATANSDTANRSKLHRTSMAARSSQAGALGLKSSAWLGK